MRKSKGTVNLANLKIMFGRLFEEIDLTTNGKSSGQVFSCTTVFSATP